MLIVARTPEEARQHLATIVKILVALGFVINLDKSIPPGPAVLSPVGEEEIACSEEGSQLPVPSGSHHRDEDGATMVGGGGMPPQWETLENQPVGCVYRIGCFQMGWGAFSQGKSAGGPWIAEEKEHNINYLELLAAFLALKSFVKTKEVSVLLRLDNITAIAFVNKMGGTHSKQLSDLAVEIGKWCLARRILVHAEHLPGVENTRADWESRHVEESGDWMLDCQVFEQLNQLLGPFTVDLFASRTNAQLPQYCSWRPYPEAWSVDAFTVSWATQYPYMFPPFLLIPQCLSKMRSEQSSGLLIAPVWPNQVWFPQLLRHLRGFPILLPPTGDIVTGPDGSNHPMAMEGHLPLAAWPISGDPTMLRDFQTELSRSSESRGDPPLRQLTHLPGNNGIAGALNGAVIPFQHL